MYFNDIFDIILNIWHRIRTIWQFKFIIPCWRYYLKFVVLILLSYIVPRVINNFWRAICLIELIKSNLYDALFILLFSVFWVYVYCFHIYIWVIIVQYPFLFYSQLKIAFYDYFNLMVHILVNIFRPIKIKTRSFRISYQHHIFFRNYNDLINLL